MKRWSCRITKDGSMLQSKSNIRIDSIRAISGRISSGPRNIGFAPEEGTATFNLDCSIKRKQYVITVSKNVLSMLHQN